MDLIDYLKTLICNKKILILGFGREGKSTFNVLAKVGGYEELAIADSRDITEELPVKVSLCCGMDYLDCLDGYDIVFKSPGVVLPKDISEYKCDIVSQTEIFIRCYGKQVIGITGTKGKSTTSSLMYHVLKECGKDVLFAGNIGIPVFDVVNDITKESIIVLELSCHQLEYALTSPGRAIILNLYEDHLDHYGTREKYINAKKNIYLHQGKDDVFYSTKEAVVETENIPGRTVCVDASMAPLRSLEEVEGCLLRGNHNLLNVAFVYSVCCEFGIERDEFVKALATFKPLKHRLELAVKKNGIDFYDDSISTTVKSTISAVESIKNASILLIGGMERNIEYSELVNYLSTSKLKYIICMYDAGKRFFEMYIDASKNIKEAPVAKLVSNLEEAVELSMKLAVENDAVILSPAAASYGYFKNFEERGDCFVSLVKNK